ncbi:MAG: M20/M25/M40 family metallo-hydrolase [Phycisphaerales bacterium]
MPVMTTQTDLNALIARRESALREDLRRYVAIPTGFNHTRGLDEFRGLVVGRCEALGARTALVPGTPRPDWLHAGDEGAADESSYVVPPAAVCSRPVPGLRRILIASHLDTVFDPRGPFLKLDWSPDGAKGVGPGVVDMKGGIVIALHALEALAEAGHELSWTYFFNSDEETGTYHSAEALMEQARAHDWGLATEPALPDGSIAVERKGSGQFIVEAFGKSAHAGRDFEKGVSAVYKLAAVLTKIERLIDLSAGVTVNIGPLKGGAATNIVPDYAAAWGNVRYPSEQASETFRVGLEALSEVADGTTPAPGQVRIRHSLNRPAKPRTPGSMRIAEIARDAAEGLGQRVGFGATGGVCDGNIMQAVGLPTIDNLGVRGGGLHTHQEWIESASLVERCQLLAAVLLRLSREAPPER